MRKIPKKNYFILFLAFLGVFIVTFAFAKFYNNTLKPTSVLYKYAKHINSNEMIDYMQENSSIIIYLSDKYNVLLNDEEELLKEKIIEYNLYNNFVYIDKNKVGDDFYKEFNEKYNVHISEENMPILIVLNDSNLENIYYNLNSDIINEIKFGDIKW